MDLDLRHVFCGIHKPNKELLHTIPEEDEFWKRLKKLPSDRNIKVTVIFPARLFLDLHDILGGKLRRRYQDLAKTSEGIPTVFKSTGIFSAKRIRFASPVMAWSLHRNWSSLYKEVNLKGLNLTRIGYRGVSGEQKITQITSKDIELAVCFKYVGTKVQGGKIDLRDIKLTVDPRFCLWAPRLSLFFFLLTALLVKNYVARCFKERVSVMYSVCRASISLD